jgi:hypothetical protein
MTAKPVSSSTARQAQLEPSQPSVSKTTMMSQRKQDPQPHPRRLTSILLVK